jgi:hypothetical protein
VRDDDVLDSLRGWLAVPSFVGVEPLAHHHRTTALFNREVRHIAFHIASLDRDSGIAVIPIGVGEAR